MTMDSGIHVCPAPVLAERTSIHLGGAALAEVRITKEQGLDALLETLARLGGQVALLGAGTNIIAADGPLPFVLVKLDFVEEPVVIREEGETVFVFAPASTRMPALLRFCAQNGLSGLEGLCGIPGSVGGALAMNAGSYGTNIANRLHAIQVFSPQHGRCELATEQMQFSYRSCLWPGHDTWFLVTGAVFALQRASHNAIWAAMADVIIKKKKTQPVTAKSAGCVFKNPSDVLSAGKALDVAGCRGLRLGGMAFSPMHANFLVNEGKGSFAAAQELLHMAQEKVYAMFSLHLELEVKLWR